MKRFFTMLTVSGMLLTANAQNAGDNVYTSNGKYLITTGENLLSNGDFSNGTEDWTTDGGTSLNADTFSIETAVDGNKFLQVYMKEKGPGNGSTLFRTVPVNAGQVYFITYQVKCTEGMTYTSNIISGKSENDYQNIFFNTDKSLTAELSIAKKQTYNDSWTTISYAFTPRKAGYIVFHFFAPYIGNCFDNFKVLEARQLIDDREANKNIARLKSYLDNPLFPNGHEILEDFISAINDYISVGDVNGYNDIISLIDEAIDEFLNANSAKVTDYLIGADFEKADGAIGKTATWVGTADGWQLWGTRWVLSAFTETNAAFTNNYLRRYFPAKNGGRLAEGGFYQTMNGMPAGNYLFSIKSRAKRTSGSNDVLEEDYDIHNLKLFINKDSVEMYPIHHTNSTTFSVIGNQPEEGDLSLGFYMPGNDINVVEFDNADLRLIGWTQEQADEYFMRREFAEHKKSLLDAINNAKAMTTSELYKYGIPELQVKIDSIQTVYETVSTSDEADDAMSALSSAVSSFKNINKLYTTLQNTIISAVSQMNDETMTQGREELLQAIDVAKAFVAALTDEKSVETDQATVTQTEELIAAMSRFAIANLKGDEKYIFAEWASVDGAEFNSLREESSVKTNSDNGKLFVETASFAGHDLNRRFAFKSQSSTNTFYTLDAEHGLSIKATGKNNVTMSILDLKAGDQVTVDWMLGSQSHELNVISGNFWYYDEDGTRITSTKTGKTEESKMINGANAKGVGGKCRTVFNMTATGTLDFQQSTSNSTLYIGFVGITYAGLDGIAETQLSRPVRDGALYDLQGRRLSGKPAKGLYIHNGKKILVK